MFMIYAHTRFSRQVLKKEYLQELCISDVVQFQTSSRYQRQFEGSLANT